MRLDKFVSDAAALTRSESRKLIKNGRISVSGNVVKEIAYHIEENAEVLLDEERIFYKKFIYIMLNKPQGFVSATEDKRQKTVLDLLDASYSRYQLFPVGRLDVDTEGFLLLTNDGELAHNMLAPNKNVGKTYFLRLRDDVDDKMLEMLQNGVDIGDCVTKPAKAQKVSDREIYLTITEGKFHQIKRMAKSVGNEVVYLKRVAYGNFYLDNNLKTGSYRVLSEEEAEYLCKVYKRK